MSQQSLNSKTITKRNVAQSSVIFSVVVTVITLGVIVTVAYLDITEQNEVAATDRSIPKILAEMKQKSAENQKQIELKSQAEELVVVIDERVESLDALDQHVQQVSDQFNFVTANLKAPEPVQQTKAVIQPTVKTVLVDDGLSAQQIIQSVYAFNQSVKLSNAQQTSMDGEAYFKLNWLFSARGNMQLVSDFNVMNNWNAKSF